MKLMVGYDGTNAAKEALKLAGRHAEAFGGEVHVVTSMPRGKADDQEKILSLESQLDWAKSTLESKGLNCKTHLLIRGLGAGEDLVEFAEENRIDQIFIGVKRRSRVEKILLGSTAQFVIIKAPCAVVTVK